MLRMLAKQACVGILATSFAILCLAGLTFAQNTNSGDIRGVVTDPSGAVVPNAKVTVLDVDTGVAHTLYTNPTGLYDTVSILPGHYTVTFSKLGFKTIVRKGITIQVGPPVTINATLTIGATQQTVQVTSQAPLLQTESAVQGTNLQSHTMTELPNVSRNWTNFTQLLPGVAPGTGGLTVGSVSAGYSVAVNGSMPNYASFLADGASVALPHSWNLSAPTDFAAIAEVQINTSTFSAEYGNGGAVFNQISKSGTDQWHGAAYEFVQNTAFNARSFFLPSVPVLHFNNFGASVGGPIRKDKAFFFFNVDKVTNTSVAPSFYTFPTAAMRSGDFSNSIFPTIYDPQTLSNGSRAAFPDNKIPANRMDPLATKVQNYFPLPNLPGFANNYLFVAHTTSPSLTFFGRTDFDISERNRLTVSFQRNNAPAFTDSPDCPIDCYPGGGKNYQAQISDVWSLSPSTVNEFRFGWVRQFYFERSESLGKNYPQQLGWTYAKANMFPGVSIGGPVGGTSIGTNLNDATYSEDGWDPSDTLTLIRGRHIIKFGAEVLYLQDDDTGWGNIHAGDFNFSGVYTAQTPFGKGGLGYADFLLGKVQSWSASIGPIDAMREIQPQMFVQDGYKITPHLTLDLGLRYQIQGGWHELHNQLGSFDPSIINSATNTAGAIWFSPNDGRNSLQAQVNDVVLPRLGFAWNVKSDWVVRGGFGMYGNSWSQDTYSGCCEGFGASSSGSLFDSTDASPLFQFSASNPTLNYTGASRSPDGYDGRNVPYAPYHTPVAKSYEWSVSVQRQLRGGMVVQAAYVANHSNGLSFPTNINQVPESMLGTSPNPQSLRPYPQFLNISGSAPFTAISNYNSLQLSIDKNFSRGLTFGANYTWSQLLDDQDSSNWGGHVGAQNYQNAYLPSVNYGYSNFNRTNMIKGYTVYQLPVGNGRKLLNLHGPADWVLGGWQVSPMVIWESGSPYTATMGGPNLTGALAGSWFPNLVGNSRLSNPTIDDYFNTAAFAKPAAFTFGNAGRNILFGPSLSSVDFSLAKNFHIPKLEAGNLQIRLDSDNIINRPSFSNPNASIGTPSAGTIRSTTIGGRVIQLGARFSF